MTIPIRLIAQGRMGILSLYYSLSTAGMIDIVLVGSRTHTPNVAILWKMAESSNFVAARALYLGLLTLYYCVSSD